MRGKTNLMKNLKIGLGLGCAILAGLGAALAVTNPGSKDYENYASTELNLYLKENVCKETSEDFGDFVKRLCPSIVDTIRPQLQQLIIKNTKRQNFILFSIYSTDLSLPSPLPGYYFETVGAFNNFSTYSVEKN